MSEVHGIGWAVKQMSNGSIVRRTSWGPGTSLSLLDEQRIPTGKPPQDPARDLIVPAYFRLLDGQRLTPWQPSSGDLLAVDWETLG